MIIMIEAATKWSCFISVHAK